MLGSNGTLVGEPDSRRPEDEVRGVVAKAAGTGLLLVYLIVFSFGTIVVAAVFGASIWRAFHGSIDTLWQRLRAAVLIAAWFFGLSYAGVVLFWLNRAALPEVLAYAAGSAFAFFVIRKIRSGRAPQTARGLAAIAATLVLSIFAYSWGLRSAAIRGWSESGYFIAYKKCGSSFDRCIESGPYRTPAECDRELIAVNGSLDANDCIELQEVPRVYLPWTR